MHSKIVKIVFLIFSLILLKTITSGAEQLKSTKANKSYHWTIVVDKENKVWSVLESDSESSGGRIEFIASTHRINKGFTDVSNDANGIINLRKRKRTKNYFLYL